MAIRTISFRARSETIKHLDEIAAEQKRDRTFILNKAIDSFLSSPGYPHVPRNVETGGTSDDSKSRRAGNLPKNRLRKLTPLDLINSQSSTSRHPLLKEMVSAWEKDWSAL